MTTSPNRLLFDFLCTPVSMRADRLFALVADLHANKARRSLPEPRSESWGKDALEPWNEPLYTIENGLATVRVSGELVKGYDAVTCWCWGLASIDRLQETVEEIGDRSDARAVLFVIDSPGGVCTGMPELCDQIVKLGTTKRTESVTSDHACSNGYRIAAAAGKVFTTESAQLGCIGTYMAFYDYSEMLKEMGIKLELFSEGAFKGMGLPGNPLTDEQRAFLKTSVKRCNDRFTSFVRDRRGNVAESTMQGQWFDGHQAVQLKLADQVVPSVSAHRAQMLRGPIAAAAPSVRAGVSAALPKMPLRATAPDPLDTLVAGILSDASAAFDLLRDKAGAAETFLKAKGVGPKSGGLYKYQVLIGAMPRAVFSAKDVPMRMAAAFGALAKDMTTVPLENHPEFGRAVIAGALISRSREINAAISATARPSPAR